MWIFTGNNVTNKQNCTENNQKDGIANGEYGHKKAPERKLNSNESNQKIKKENASTEFRMKMSIFNFKTTVSAWIEYGQMQIHRIEFNRIDET